MYSPRGNSSGKKKNFFFPPRNLINFWSFYLILFLKLFYFVWSFWCCAQIYENPPQQRPKSGPKLNLSKIARNFTSILAFRFKILLYFDHSRGFSVPKSILVMQKTRKMVFWDNFVLFYHWNPCQIGKFKKILRLSHPWAEGL